MVLVSFKITEVLCLVEVTLDSSVVFDCPTTHSVAIEGGSGRNDDFLATLVMRHDRMGLEAGGRQRVLVSGSELEIRLGSR